MGSTASCECENVYVYCHAFRHRCICPTIGPNYCLAGRKGRPGQCHYCYCHSDKRQCRAMDHKKIVNT